MNKGESMTYVSTPQTSASGGARIRRFGPIVAAVAIVVAAGAAIAVGITLNEPATNVAGTQSIYGNLEALKYVSPSAPVPDRADQVHRGRTPAIEGATGFDTTTSAGKQALVAELVRQGHVPTGAIPTANQPNPFYEPASGPE